MTNGLVWHYYGLDKPPSRDTIDRFLTDLEHVIDNIFDRLVEQAAAHGLLDSTYSIDSTHVEVIQRDDAASWNYDPAVEEYYYGLGFLNSFGSRVSQTARRGIGTTCPTATPAPAVSNRRRLRYSHSYCRLIET